MEILVHNKQRSLWVQTQVTENKITAIYGASGAGKSSLLEAIAGFLPCEQLKIIFDQRTVADQAQKIQVPLWRRDVGYVSQNAELFAFLTVQNNILYGLSRITKKKQSINPDLWKNWVKLLEIDDILQKKPHQLSGGQRKRVALVQTLVLNPKLLLLDEPFNSLNERLQKILYQKIRQWQQQQQATVVLVSHDLNDLLHLADDVLWVEKGTVKAAGLISKVWPKITNFFDQNTFLIPCTQIKKKSTSVCLNLLDHQIETLYTGKAAAQYLVLLRPNDFYPVIHKANRKNVLTGTVVQMQYKENYLLLTCQIGNQQYCLQRFAPEQAIFNWQENAHAHWQLPALLPLYPRHEVED